MTDAKREQRAHPRYATDKAAELIAGGTRANVTIRDVCLSGLFVAWTDVAPEQGAIGRGTWVEVRMRLGGESGRRSIRARVARSGTAGMGLAVHAGSQDVTRRMVDEASARDRAPTEPAAEGERISTEARRRVLRRCRQELEQFAGEGLQVFAEQAGDELFTLADRASSDAEQARYVRARKTLSAGRETCARHFVHVLLTRLDALGEFRLDRRDAPQGEGELSLIENEDLERWLARSEQVTAAEQRQRNRLLALRHRLSALAGIDIDESTDPLGPAAVFDAFGQALDRLDLEHSEILTLYEVFGRHVLSKLGELYDKLNRVMAQEGIFPQLSDDPISLQRHVRHRPRGDNPRQGRSTSGAADSGPHAQRHEGLTSAAATQTPAGPQAAAPPHGSGTAEGFGASPRTQQLASLLAAAVSTRSAPHNGDRAPPAVAMTGGDNTSWGRALAALQARIAGGETGAPGSLDELAERAVEHPGDGGAGGDGAGTYAAAAVAELPAITRIVEALLSALADDPLGSERLGPWTQRARLPIHRAVLAREGFIEDPQHPARRLLDQLDRVAQCAAAAPAQASAALDERVDGILARLLERFDGDPASLEPPVAELQALIERQDRARQANVERVLSQAQGADRLRRARRDVDAALRRHLGETTVPRPITEILEAGWRNLLVRSLLREGRSSKTWIECLVVVDQLNRWLTGGPEAVPEAASLEHLVSLVDRELTDISPDPQRRRDAVALLRSAVRGELAGDDPRLAPRPLPEAQERAEHASPSAQSHYWRGLAKLLAVGDWAVLGTGSQARYARLAWVADDRSRYVLVGQQGRKAADLALDEVAAALADGRLQLLEVRDRPAFERAWQRMLEQTNAELSAALARDPVTGLLLYEAFETQLARTLGEQLPADRENALLLIALGEREPIGGATGREAMDRLLPAVTARLAAQLAPDTPMGRIGDGELACLLVDSGEDRARVTAQALQDALADHQLEWRGERFSVDSNVAVMPLQPRHSSIAGALLSELRAAGLDMVGTGWSQVDIVRPGTSRAALTQGSASSISAIDEALREDRLRLRCQRIQPLDPHSGLKPHHEILMELVDSDGRTIAPEELIPVAERNARMAALDRWVMDKSFAWMAEHRETLAGMATLSINLSGQSLNDPDFGAAVDALYRQHRPPLTALCFEITETVAVSNLEALADFIHRWRSRGCSFALDDFGARQASYRCLETLPVDYIKIDGSIVGEATTSHIARAMVRSINELAHDLGKHTVGEHASDERIISCLRELGVDFAQGYGVALPRPLSELKYPESGS